MQNIIISYIKDIKKDDIISFCNKNKISYTNKEIEIIYFYIKEKYNTFFNNPDIIFNEIKEKISDSLYKKIKELYNKYKSFINYF